MVIDFTHKSLLYRLKTSGKKQMLPKACGLHLGYNNIIDTTAGLGEDALVLAFLGCNITLIERNKTVFNALDKAIKEAKHEPYLKETANRLNLIHGNAIEILPTLDNADVIYCDPMFPERQKSALVKKPMIELKEIVGKDEDDAELLAAALNHTAKRVVVKRPKLAPPIKNHPPSFEIKGKSGRFDIYLKN